LVTVTTMQRSRPVTRKGCSCQSMSKPAAATSTPDRSSEFLLMCLHVVALLGHSPRSSCRLTTESSPRTRCASMTQGS
jgi:hypothetical protein